jgi:LacI family transcriptional regulator
MEENKFSETQNNGPFDEEIVATMTAGKHRAPTMADIAREANVSVTTVSRVINQSVPVDADTEARVRTAIGKLGYRPNLLARSFRRRVTHTIGLLVPDNSNPFFAEVARAIEDAGFREGYNVILCNSDLSQEKQEAYLDVLLAKQVDGLILVSSGLITLPDGQDPIRRVMETRVPCVVVDRDLGDLPIDQVLVDNEQGGYLAGRYLTGLGHRDIACIVGPSDVTPSAGRFAGFERALAQADPDLKPTAYVSCNGRNDGGEAAVEELLATGAPFTAIFVFNDLVAIGVHGALRRAGLRVPEDVSLVSFDNVKLASAVYPPLTTVAQPIAEIGDLAVRLLLNRIADIDVPHARVVLPTLLIERESCGPPATVTLAVGQDGPEIMASDVH